MTPGSRPPRMLRPLLRSPRILYRLRLGRLLDRRFLLLEHRGRRSGKVRATVLEIVRYDAATRESVVVSAWGGTSDWYRNVTRQPAVSITIAGRRWLAPHQRLLDADETHRTLEGYRARHRLVSRMLAVVIGWPLNASEAERQAFAARMPAVALRPNQTGSPDENPSG